MNAPVLPRTTALLAITVALTAGCASPPLSKSVDADNEAARTALKAKLEEIAKAQSRFQEIDGPAIAVKPLNREKQAATAREWLSSVHITLDPAKDAAVPASAIMRQLRAKGLNITSVLPLDDYSYNGYGVSMVSAETALLVFFGSMGLDYEINDAQRLVTILPLKARTWTLNLGNRVTGYSNSGSGPGSVSSGSGGGSAMGSASSGSSTTASSSGSGAGSSYVAGNTGSSGTTGNSAGGSSLNSNTAAATGGNNGNTITSNDNFWTTLETELNARIKIYIPRKPSKTGPQPVVPAMSQMFPMGAGLNGMPGALAPGMNGTPLNMGLPGGASPDSELYSLQKIANYAINPVTGAVTVQGPKFLLDSLDKYFEAIQESYNTEIIFDGELVSVAIDKSRNDALDLSLLSKFSAGGATAVFSNNILGGVATLLGTSTATATTTPAVSVGNTTLPGAGTVIGATSTNGHFSVFNAFLSSIGQITVHEKPRVASTNGAPVNFGKTTVAYYPSYSQTAAAGGSTGSAVTATNTIDVPYTTGLRIRINPRYDPITGLVRAQVYLWRQMVSGWDQKINIFSTGNGIQQIPSRTPRLTGLDEDSEILLHDGETIILGGLTEDNHDNNDSGVTGLLDTPLRALTGSSVRNSTTSTYYYALRVSIRKKNI